MKKRMIFGLLALCLLLTTLTPMTHAEETTAPAETTETTIPPEERSDLVYEDPTEATDPTEETRAPGYCGEELTWELSGGTLTISGKGPMDDYTAGGAPWYDSRDSITSIVLSGGVTRIGEEAFSDYDKLTTVDFGNSLVEIGRAAFLSCGNLTAISLPATFRLFGEDCFRDCVKLTKVSCAGPMPSFRLNCLWNGNTVTIYCPANAPWPEKYVLELEDNFHGRLQVLASDNSDPYKREEETAPTEETTVPTTEPETEPTTVPTTEPAVPETTAEATVETTEAVTTAPTEEPTQPTMPVAVPTEPAGPETSIGDRLWIPLLILSTVLTAILLGALVFRGRRSGKYSK